MTKYIQTRLRRALQTGNGYSEMVTYLPLTGIKGSHTKKGSIVHLQGDPNPNPWVVISAVKPLQPSTYFQNNYQERQQRKATV
jgi:hypothetical protein